MLNSLIPYLNHSLFPWIVSLLILIFAFSIWVFFRIFRLGPIVEQLQIAINVVEKSTLETFADDFSKINTSIKQLPLIQHPWRLFNSFLLYKKHITDTTFATTSLTDENELVTCIAYQRSPQHFFNPHTLIAAKINLRFYQSAPNLFIQLGLLFTFLGLLVALYAVGNGLIADELSQLRTSLQTLLTAATFKFLTSLSGILAAIIFSWREKNHWHQLLQLINQFNQLLEMRMSPAIQDTITATEATSKQYENTGYRLTNTEIQRHNLAWDVDNSLLISINLGFNSIKKEIQRLNTGVGVATRRLYKVIHAVGQQDLKESPKDNNQSTSGSNFQVPSKNTASFIPPKDEQ